MTPEVSVVVPTRSRPALLAASLRSLLAQDTTRSFEVIVADDGGDATVPDDPRVRVVRTGGRGAGLARNAGIADARGTIVLFTDDDTLADRRWIEEAAGALAQHPDAVGVEGPTDCAACDPLYELTTSNAQPGAYFTCNVGYRRDDLLAVGGFDEQFARTHEDVDLGLRMLERGPIVFAPGMRVLHPPRRASFGEIVGRARRIPNTWLLWRKHPQRSPKRWPQRWAPVIRIARLWQQRFVEQRVVQGSPRRALRAAALATAHTSLALYVAVTEWRRT